MTVKGTLIATLAAGYIATLAPSVHADGKAAEPAKAEGEKASCKGPNGCKGEKKAKKGEHKEEHKDEKKAEKAEEKK